MSALNGIAAVVAAIAVAGSANAADLPSRKAVAAFAAPARPFVWTGFYAGLNGGFSGGVAPGRLTTLHPVGVFGIVDFSTFDSRFGFGEVALGGQLGYNHQLPNSVVLGVETDLQWSVGKIQSKLEGIQTNLVPGFAPFVRIFSGRATGGADWLGTTRVRMGYALPNRFMPYLTAGVAYTSLSARMDYVGADSALGLSSVTHGGGRATRIGWTVGGGFEYAVNDRLSLKSEYLYSNFGGLNAPVVTYFNPTAPLAYGAINTGRFGVHVARVGLNWMFGADRAGSAGPAYASAAGLPIGEGGRPSAVPVFVWKGFYAGLNGGFSGGAAPGDVATVHPVGVFGIVDVSRFDSRFGFAQLLLGGQVGYNMELPNKIVLGLETDLQFAVDRFRTKLDGVTSYGFFSGKAAGVEDWMGTTRARIGYACLDRLLPYVTAGVAYSVLGAKMDYLSGNTVVGLRSITHGGNRSLRVGWTAGGGIEYAVSDHLTLKTEYLYSRFGGVSAPVATFFNAAAPLAYGAIRTASFGVHTARVGLNWQFGGGAQYLARR